MNAPVQGAVRAEWYGNPFAFAQGDKILAGDEFLGEELISCLPQLLALLFLGLSTPLFFPVLSHLCLLLQAQPALFPVADQRCRIAAQFLINSHEEELQMSSFLHGLLDVKMEACKKFGSDSGYVLAGEVPAAVDSMFKKDVVQL